MTRSENSASSADTGDGLSAFLGGAWFVVSTPSAWPFACVPVVMALLVWCGLAGLGLSYLDDIARRLLGAEAGAAGSWTVKILGGLLFVVLSAIVALVLAQPLSGWALEAIARKQEKRLTGRCPTEAGFVRSLCIAIRCSLFIVVASGSGTLLLLAVSLVFPPAAIVTVPLGFLLTGWGLAWGLVDYPLGLRGLGVRKRLRWARANLGGFTAFGLAWAAVLLVPGIFLLVLPLGVAGATRLVVASERDNVLDVLPA